MNRRTRVFRSPCCHVVSEARPKFPGEPVSLSMCFQCFLVHDTSTAETWLQNLLELPLGSPAPEEKP